jgi:hypothetical protein
MKEAQPNISQSLIKKIWDCKSGRECGLAVKEIDILKNYKRKQSIPMKLGCYFEYLCTGAVNRDGSVPEAPMTRKGELTTDSKRASIQATNFKEAIAHHGFNVLTAGEKVECDYKGYNLKIILDAIIETPEYPQAVLDIKYSGLLGDKWSDMGWHLDRYDEREGLKIQPIFYKYVIEKALGVRDIPFYYAIHSSKNEHSYDIWKVNIPNYDDVIANMEWKIDEVIDELENGRFDPNPEPDRCTKCPLYDDCIFKMKYPSIKDVDVSGFKDEIR